MAALPLSGYSQATLYGAACRTCYSNGLRVYIYPNAHEKALIAQVTRLLPEGASIIGKPLVYQDTRRLSVSLSGPLSTRSLEEVQGKFTEETGWKVDVEG